MQYFSRFVTECAWEVIVPMRLASALIVDRPKAKRIVVKEEMKSYFGTRFLIFLPCDRRGCFLNFKHFYSP
jgi:hypothetical protein